MLDFMRKNANSWVMILLFAIIIFVFAINFGPWAGRISENVPYAAVVNNSVISLPEFQTAYMSQLARIKQFRPDYSDEQAQKDGLKQLVLDQLVSRELLTQLGQNQKLKIGATTLAKEIKERVFGPDVPFDKEEYIRRINSYFQTTPAQFEELISKEMIAQHMAELLGTGVYISEDEARQSYQDKNTKIAVEFIKVNPQYFKVKESSLPEITNFVEKNQEQIATYYNENLKKFVREPEVKASHILIKVAPDAPAEEIEKAKGRALALLERLQKGEDFSKLAKEESEDLGSKINGGDLGFFKHGAMVPEFAEAAFKLKPNEMSELVKTPFGFHIIKVADRTEEQKTTLAMATNEIAQTLMKLERQKQEAKDLALQALQQFKNGINLDKVAIKGLINKKINKDAQADLAPIADETTSFSKSSPFIPGIGRSADFVKEAFKLNKDNKVAAEVFEANGQFFAIRLKSLEDADLTKFEEQKENIKKSLLYARQRAFVQQYLSQLKSNAKIKYNPQIMGSAEINV